jgi:Flp pilus assembly protein TadD
MGRSARARGAYPASASSESTLSAEEREAVYGLGYSLLRAGSSEDAAVVFGRLLRYDPYAVRYWQALGAALYQLGERAAAAVTLTIAALLGGPEPSPAMLAQLDQAAARLAAEGAHP